MKSVDELASGLVIGLDMDETSAYDTLRAYIKQIEELESRTIDEDAISEDDAEFLIGAIRAAHRSGELGIRELDAVAEAAQDYQDALDTAETMRQLRDKAIRAAVKAGASQTAAARAAGLTRQGVALIIH